MCEYTTSIHDKICFCPIAIALYSFVMNCSFSLEFPVIFPGTYHTCLLRTFMNV
uniref:Long chain acyl-CoA synthetase 6 peroxisomal-like n=1 Tax=Rhizophora mucronata TaxID=61149 RepID=A0A2P2JAB7_RHIMU